MRPPIPTHLDDFGIPHLFPPPSQGGKNIYLTGRILEVNGYSKVSEILEQLGREQLLKAGSQNHSSNWLDAMVFLLFFFCDFL